MNNGRRDVRVCKTAFLRTHAVTNGRLSHALKAYADNSGSPHSDERGRHTPVNKITDNDIGFVKDHIQQSFPKYRSHYSRATNPIRQYLHPDQSITKMYLLYKDVCSTQGKSQVSEGIYRKVFNEQFNLSFGTKDWPPDMGHIVPKKPYMSLRSINSAKKKDLLELLNFIPPIYIMPFTRI